LLKPYVIKRVQGMPIAFIGAVLEQTPSIVTPTGVTGLSFIDEADAINQYVPELRNMGVRSISNVTWVSAQFRCPLNFTWVSAQFPLNFLKIALIA